jgi:hypothetical protein
MTDPRPRLVAEVVDQRRYFDHSLQTVEYDVDEQVWRACCPLVTMFRY